MKINNFIKLYRERKRSFFVRTTFCRNLYQIKEGYLDYSKNLQKKF